MKRPLQSKSSLIIMRPLKGWHKSLAHQKRIRSKLQKSTASLDCKLALSLSPKIRGRERKTSKRPSVTCEWWFREWLACSHASTVKHASSRVLRSSQGFLRKRETACMLQKFKSNYRLTSCNCQDCTIAIKMCISINLSQYCWYFSAKYGNHKTRSQTAMKNIQCRAGVRPAP